MPPILGNEKRALILHFWDEARCDKAIIARMVGVSRNTVIKVIEQGVDWTPRPAVSSLDSLVDRIVELHDQCSGNVAQVRRELADEGFVVSYSTLADFCRRRGISVCPKPQGDAPRLNPVERQRVLRLLRKLLVAYSTIEPPPEPTNLRGENAR